MTTFLVPIYSFHTKRLFTTGTAQRFKSVGAELRMMGVNWGPKGLTQDIFLRTYPFSMSESTFL